MPFSSRLVSFVPLLFLVFLKGCVSISKIDVQTRPVLASASCQKFKHLELRGVQVDLAVDVHQRQRKANFLAGPNNRRPHDLLTLRGGKPESFPPDPAPQPGLSAIIGVGTWISALHAGAVSSHLFTYTHTKSEYAVDANIYALCPVIHCIWYIHASPNSVPDEVFS